MKHRYTYIHTWIKSIPLKSGKTKHATMFNLQRASDNAIVSVSSRRIQQLLRDGRLNGYNGSKWR